MDLETLLTSRDGFGLESATFLQRSICRVIDGAPVDDLLERGSDFDRRCLEMAIGCSPSLLPVGAPPTEVVDIEPVRCGKSLRMAALAVARSQTVDVGIVKAGEEPPRISLLATELDQARTLRGHLRMIDEKPKLRALKIGETDDSVTLRHPTGCPMPIAVIAAKRGGYSMATRWSGSADFDEAPTWYSTDKIISLEDSRDQVLGRLLPGAQAIYGGSPWQADGFVFKTHRDSFGKPTSDLVVIRPQMVDGVEPAAQLNPKYWTPERIAKLRRTASRTYRMHVLNQFGAGTSCFDFDKVEHAFRDRPHARWKNRAFGIIDASSGKKDTWSFCVAQWRLPRIPNDAYELQDLCDSKGQMITPMGEYVLDEFGRPKLRPGIYTQRHLAFGCIDGFAGDFWSHLPGDEVVWRVAQVFEANGVIDVHGDQRESYMLQSEFRRHGLRFHEHPYTSESKAKAVERVRRWLATDSIIIEPHDKMRAEFHAFVEKPTPGGGFTFGARGNGHDDYVCLALTAALADIEGELGGSPVQIDRGRGEGQSLDERYSWSA